MIEIFVRGGLWFMLPLFAASIAVVALAIERYLHYRRAHTDYGDFFEEIERLIRDKGIGAARGYADAMPGPVARTWREGLDAARLPFPLLRERMEAAAIEELAELERHLPHLVVIAQVSPLIGILGTIWGMIQSFQGVELGLSQGIGVQSTIVAGGIWQALITTAAGLLVAIPAVLVHHYLQGRVDAISDQLERSVADLVRALIPLRAQAPAGDARALAATEAR
ncbi:MAG: MotA/TolQ/ExbB proton channel family protein [Planctomycetes bacterium]|nr:MotA/TolQ/ExbB proton channel family protein [Planctomycetota bacterium]